VDRTGQTLFHFQGVLVNTQHLALVVYANDQVATGPVGKGNNGLQHLIKPGRQLSFELQGSPFGRFN